MQTLTTSPLIPRHVRLLDYIRDYSAVHHYAPSTREMMGAVRFCSSNSVAEVLQKFEKRGLITRKGEVARSVFVTEKGKRLLRRLGRSTRKGPPPRRGG